ncbi:LLM class F420-dependent oxidoreductase [Streptantibioticus ferralitis]
MRIGLTVTSFSWPGGPGAIGPTVARIARDADEAGLASLWVMDHFWQIPMNGSEDEPMLESYTTLAFAAAHTRRIRLGTLVTAVVYRYPGVLLKTVTTLDVLSGGRAWLGVGAGWNDAEAAGLGIPFPPVAERFERLEETLRIVRQAWSGETRPIHGRHYTLERPLNSPAPLTSPRPPILVGGSGERKTLRLVAKYADACNLFDTPEITRKLDVLREHCEREGRPYGEIEKTVAAVLPLTGPGGSVDQAADRCEELATHGIEHVILNLPGVHDPHVMERVAELVARVGKVIPAGRSLA